MCLAMDEEPLKVMMSRIYVYIYVYYVLQCIWDRTASFSYTLFVSGGLIGGPLVMMGICFILVFYKIWSSKRDLYIFDKDDPLRFVYMKW